MKVCTDACLFGAWVANKFEANQPPKILDIGTGTGLLTLMQAQKLSGTIDAVEIDENAYAQATDNISDSQWKERIKTIHADVKRHQFEHTYDLIIANPPFYENNLRSPEVISNMARHDETLTLKILLSVVIMNLLIEGSFAILIPYHRSAYFVSEAAGLNLYPSDIVNVRQSPNHNYFRSMMILKKYHSAIINEDTLVIKKDNDYTAESTELLKDYYLNL